MHMDIDRVLRYSVFQSVDQRAVNSVGECHLDMVEVVGSNPIPPRQPGTFGYPAVSCHGNWVKAASSNFQNPETSTCVPTRAARGSDDGFAQVFPVVIGSCNSTVT